MPVVCVHVSVWVYWCVYACASVTCTHFEVHTCMTNQQHPQTVCVQRKCISSSLPFSTPSTAAHQGLIAQHQPVCVLQQHEVIRRNTHSQRHKNLCSLQNMGIFVPVQTTLESDAVLLAFCAHMNFFLLGVYKYTHCAVAVAVIEL